MGAVQNVVDRLRRAFVMDKERGGDLLAKGSTSPTYPDSGYDLLQAYGYDALSDYLRLEHDLLSRYVDYEEMDDYPEVSSAIDIYADDASQPDTQLWVAGADRTARWQRAARSLGVESRVRFLGFRRDMRTLYAAADALLLPTRYDACAMGDTTLSCSTCSIRPK